MIEQKRANSLRKVILLLLLIVAIYALLVYLRILPIEGTLNIIVAIIGGAVAIEVMAWIVYAYFARNIVKEEAESLHNLFRIIAYMILLFLILSIVVGGIKNLIGSAVIAGFLGIVFGLAVQTTLSNFIAGIYLLASKSFETGDRVTIHTWQYGMQPQSYPHDRFVPGFSGVIKNIGVLNTEVTNDEGIPIFIPNNIVAQALIINHHKAKTRYITLQFDVALDIPFKKLKEVIDSTMKRKRIKGYKANIEYLHSQLYVVTLHLNMGAIDIKDLKSDIFNEIILFLGNKKKSA